MYSHTGDTMSEFFFKNDPEWTRDLRDYYNVTHEKAVELGTRSPNRKPSLPSSSTTHAVSGLTFEDIWQMSPRTSQKEIFQFYKDQGAWAAFRQVVRHKDMTNYHLSILSRILREDSVFCEYGCGVAPYTYSLLNHISEDSKITIYLSDVESEHLTFGFWRAKRVIEERGLKNVSLTKIPVEPDSLPQYKRNLDSVLIFEVLEHVPSPLKTINNLYDQMITGGIICENFIKHEDDGQDGPDLKSAALERDKYYDFLKEKFKIVGGEDVEASPNATRVWEKT